MNYGYWYFFAGRNIFQDFQDFASFSEQEKENAVQDLFTILNAISKEFTIIS